MLGITFAGATALVEAEKAALVYGALQTALLPETKFLQTAGKYKRNAAVV